MDNKKIFQNERDIEIPLLLEFVQRRGSKNKSLLDVGCAYAEYLDDLRPLVGGIHGIDLLPDKTRIDFFDKFYKGDFLITDLPEFDLVISVSTVEHIGVEYLPVPHYRELQIEAIYKMVKLAREAVFLTAPYGEAILNEGKYYQLNARFLDDVAKEIRPFMLKKRFISTHDRRDPAGWRVVPQSLADKATNELSGGVNTIVVLEI